MIETPYFTEYEELRTKYPIGSKWRYHIGSSLVVSIRAFNLDGLLLMYEDGSGVQTNVGRTYFNLMFTKLNDD